MEAKSTCLGVVLGVITGVVEGPGKTLMPLTVYLLMETPGVSSSAMLAGVQLLSGVWRKGLAM